MIATAGIGGAIYFARDAVYRNDEFHRWIDARPMESRIDLAAPGEVTLPFDQTCGVSHGEEIRLQLNPPLDEVTELSFLFEGLSARIVIKDSGENEIESINVDSSTVHRRGVVEDVVLARFAPFAEGAYTATVHVTSGATLLTDREQLIYAKYQLCGLERFPALISGAYSFGLGVIGLISLVYVVPGVLRYGIWSDIAAGQPQDIIEAGPRRDEEV